jgi:ribosomal protein L15
LIQVMIQKILLIQFVSSVNLIQMWLTKVIDIRENRENKELQHCEESKLENQHNYVQNKKIARAQFHRRLRCVGDKNLISPSSHLLFPLLLLHQCRSRSSKKWELTVYISEMPLFQRISKSGFSRVVNSQSESLWQKLGLWINFDVSHKTKSKTWKASTEPQRKGARGTTMVVNRGRSDEQFSSPVKQSRYRILNSKMTNVNSKREGGTHLESLNLSIEISIREVQTENSKIQGKISDFRI